MVCEELDFADNLFILLFRLNGVLFRRPVGDVTLEIEMVGVVLDGDVN